MAAEPARSHAERVNTAEYGMLRCSDADREPVMDLLKQAYAEGRIDHDELDMRIHLTMTAKTYDDLALVTRDLRPAPGHDLVRPDQGGRLDQGVRSEKVLAALAHASGYFTFFVGPLLFMLMAGRRSAYVRRHAVEALNFQLTVLLLVVVTLGLAGFVFSFTWIVAGIAAVVALTGRRFRYPLTLRLIK